MSAEKEKTEIEIKISSYKGLSPVGQLVVISLNFLLFFALPFCISPTFCICFIHICKQSFRSIQLLGEEAIFYSTVKWRPHKRAHTHNGTHTATPRIASDSIRPIVDMHEHPHTYTRASRGAFVSCRSASCFGFILLQLL